MTNSIISFAHAAHGHFLPQTKCRYSFTQVYIIYCIFTSTVCISSHTPRFLFEGNTLRPEQTADELKMEDGDEIDCMLSQIGGHKSPLLDYLSKYASKHCHQTPHPSNSMPDLICDSDSDDDNTMYSHTPHIASHHLLSEVQVLINTVRFWPIQRPFISVQWWVEFQKRGLPHYHTIITEHIDV